MSYQLKSSQRNYQHKLMVETKILPNCTTKKLMIFMGCPSSDIFLAKGIRADRVAACSLLAYR